MEHTIRSEWSTARLLVSDITELAIQAAQALYEKSAFMQEWTGHKQEPEYIRHCFFGGDLPPNGHRDNLKIQVVRGSTEKMFGLLILYHGYPHGKCTYITFLFIDPEQQRQGLGYELTIELFNQLRSIGYDEVRANVQLKNWPALRFWAKVGLTTIAGIYGDQNCSDNTYADVELSMIL